jgi:hypothetical protein
MASRFYNYQEPDLYGDQFGEFYYDPYTGEFVSVPAVSGIGAPEVAYVAPQPEPAQSSTPTLTPEFLQQLQQGAATVGNAAQSGGISALFAPGTLSQFDPLYDYAKTAPILSLKGNTEYENLNFQALPDTNYRLTVGGNVIGSASTPQEVAQLVDQANAISESGGAKVDVRLQKEVQAATRTGEPITAFEDVYANKENNMGALETLIPAALAVMGGAALGPLIQAGQVAGSASALGAGLGSAAGSFAGSMATGSDIKAALTKAAISGLTAGAIKGLMPGGTAPAVPGTEIPFTEVAPTGSLGFGLSAPSTFLPAFANPITGALGSAATGTLSGIGGANEILVQAPRIVSNLVPSAIAGGVANVALPTFGSVDIPTGTIVAAPEVEAAAAEAPPEAAQGEIVVSGTTLPKVDLSGLGGLVPDLIPAPAAPAPSLLETAVAQQETAPQTADEEIVVSNTATPKVDLSGLGGLVPSVFAPAAVVAEPLAPVATQPEAPIADEEIVVSNTATPKVDLSGLGGLVPSLIPAPPAAAPSLIETAVAQQQPAETPAEEEIVVSNTATPRVDLSGLGGLVPALISATPAAPAVEILPGEELIDVAARRLPETRLDSGLAAAAGSLFPAASADVSLPGEELIDVAAKRLPETRLPETIAAATGALAPAAQPVAEVVPGEIVVTSTPTRPGEISSGISALTPEVLRNIVSATESLGYAPSTVEEEALAEGRRYEKPSIASALAVPVSQTYPIAEGATDVLPDDETLVEGRRIQPPPIDAALVGLPVAAAVAAPAVLSGGAAPQGPLGTSTPSSAATATGTGGLTARQVLNGITAANVVGGLVSDALGGDGGGGGPLDVGTGYTVPSGRARQRNAATFDPFTYGQSEGEFAFFGDGMAEGGEVDDDMVSHLIAYRKGGGHMGPGQVKGIGSGQEDKIPAWLSDGEYVWSAQDVADLGDGSTDEGVRRLDRMRKMVRQRAGRKDVKKIAKPQRGIEDMLKAVGGAV